MLEEVELSQRLWTGLPDFLEYNESTKKIQFKEGVTSVPSLPEGTNVQPHNVTITVVDNAGNETSTQVTNYCEVNDY